MALNFYAPQTATIRGRLQDSDQYLSIAGVTSGTTSVENAAAQINKLIIVGGKQMSADKYMTRTIKEEATEGD